MRSQRVRLLRLAVFTVAVASACQFDSVTVPQGQERPVVHSILNPWVHEEVVLVERTLTGRVTVREDDRYNRNDPIVSGGGVPIRNARVVLYNAANDSVVAVEDVNIREDRLGAGVYRFLNPASPSAPGTSPLPRLAIRPGGTYRLRVTTPAGEVVTAQTVVPLVPPFAPPTGTRFFNRDVDTLHLFWDAVQRSQRYLVRIESPWGPMFLFTDQLEARLAGTLRNVFQTNIPSVFLPGFRSTVSVAAVDASYFDYYRSASDPFTGTGLINRMEGGVGVFGAVSELYSYRLLVTATVNDPIEGAYRLRGQTGFVFAPPSLDIFLETRSAQGDFITGRYAGRGEVPGASFIGRVVNEDISIAFLRFENEIGDTVATLTGRVIGDSVIGTIRPRGTGIVEAVRYGK
jgi:hypothetical protein